MISEIFKLGHSNRYWFSQSIVAIVKTKKIYEFFDIELLQRQLQRKTEKQLVRSSCHPAASEHTSVVPGALSGREGGTGTGKTPPAQGSQVSVVETQWEHLGDAL